jgi:prophage tail gpP-like protein
MAQYDADSPDNQTLNITVTPPAGGQSVQYTSFISYDYISDFLSPSDSGSFTLNTGELTRQDTQTLVLGAKVAVTLNGVTQSIGYIDDLHYSGSRKSGSLLEIRFRDWLARAVDAELDPNGVRYKDGMTLDQLITQTFAPFGIQAFVNDNYANRDAIRGRTYGVKSSQRKRKPINDPIYKLQALKPYDAEGVFTFASRVSQLMGLWIWPAVDGKTLIVSTPEFDQDPSYQIHLRLDASDVHNNVIDWDVTKSRKQQPWFIVSRGFGGGGATPKTSIQTYIINPYVQTTLDPAKYFGAQKCNPGPPKNTQQQPDLLTQAVQQFLLTGNSENSSAILRVPNPTPTQATALAQQYPTSQAIIPPFDIDQFSDLSFIPIQEPFPAPMFSRATEAHNQAQVNAHLQKQLSLHTRKLLTASYTIEGHQLNGQPIAIDTIVDVDDDISNLHLQLWVKGRRFHKAAGSTGTTTTLECCLPNTLVF